MSSLEQQTQELLSQAASHAIRACVVETTHAARGSIPATIQQTAVEEACDLIIMGARQVVGVQRRTLGGIVNAVAAQAAQPVMVIKTASELDHPLGRRLLVATGGSPWSEVAVEHALQLAQALQLELCVIHVESGPRQPGNTPRPAEESSVLASVTMRAEALGMTCEGRLASGDIAEAILTTTSNPPCSAVALGSRGVIGWSRPRLGAIVNAVAARTALPVLIVKHFEPA